MRLVRQKDYIEEEDLSPFIYHVFWTSMSTVGLIYFLDKTSMWTVGLKVFSGLYIYVNCRPNIFFRQNIYVD